MKHKNLSELKVGLVSISDRASKKVYEDQGIPKLKEWLEKAIASPYVTLEQLIPDEMKLIEKTLCTLADEDLCHLILTTGGTGPAERDVTPDATINIADKVLPGFGEQMRQISLNFVPTAILSRQTAVTRKGCLIINLPGQPKAIDETLGGISNSNGEKDVNGIFSAVPYGIELLGGPSIITNDEVCVAFRPKKKE